MRCGSSLATGWALRRRQDGSIPGDGERPDQDVQDRTREQPQRTILCTACGHRITDVDARIEMAGRHEHTCVNPGGYVYRIGCFRDAPGCVGTGGWSAHYSWFADYVWQVACCGSCSMHLGWAFDPERSDGETKRFWGLIVDRITEATSEPSSLS